MPTFDYECECGFIEKDYLTFVKDEKIICPECKKDMKMFFGSGGRLMVKFVGSGFHATTFDQRKWNGKKYCDDYRQISEGDAVSINANNNNFDKNNKNKDQWGVDSSSIKPIEHNIIKPQATKLI